MAEEKKKGVRRLIKSPVPQEDKVVVLPALQNMMDDALQTLSAEIVRFRNKSVRERTALTPNEARVLQGYIKSLVDLSKESREREDDNDLSKLSDDELLALVEGLRAKKEREGQKNG